MANIATTTGLPDTVLFERLITTIIRGDRRWNGLSSRKWAHLVQWVLYDINLVKTFMLDRGNHSDLITLRKALHGMIDTAFDAETLQGEGAIVNLQLRTTNKIVKFTDDGHEFFRWSLEDVAGENPYDSPVELDDVVGNARRNFRNQPLDFEYNPEDDPDTASDEDDNNAGTHSLLSANQAPLPNRPLPPANQAPPPPSNHDEPAGSAAQDAQARQAPENASERPVIQEEPERPSIRRIGEYKYTFYTYIITHTFKL
jgi:hypothetical protein